MEQQSLFENEPAPWESDADEQRLIAEIVLAEPPFGPFDYLVPPQMAGAVAIGKRLQVPFGRGNRAVSAYCIDVAYRRPSRRRLKEVRGVIDEQPLFSPTTLKLMRWISDYYLSPLGQTIEGVIPSGVRGQAGTREYTFLTVPPQVTARLSQLKLPAKQAEAIGILAASPTPLTAPQLAAAARCTMSPISSLRKKGLVTATVRRMETSDHDLAPADREAPLPLSEQQATAMQATLHAVRNKLHETILIHGVTGSGKTEVYLQTIDEVISYGRQAIVLVPEISLTPQTKRRFRARFDRVAVLHSHLSPAERHWHWRRIAEGKAQVVVGARSAVFAPTPNLGLIVLDEEHDASFKQDTAPRYHARDVAIFRAAQEQVPLLLGSATPSLESWNAAQTGYFRLIQMPNRVLDRPLPDVAMLDLRADFQNRKNRGAISRQLQNAMREALADKGQVILLLNRRGHSTSIQCHACGAVVKCDACDIALTFHREGDRAVCHYCDYEITAPSRCADCGFEGIRYGGLGTQRLEAEIRARFPGATCLRMDSDSMKKPGSHEEALERFRKGEIQILVGTQMIAKGLDFPNVTLVGVVNADTALHLPDFRSAERTFQLVTQVAGRTGRGDRGGRVLVQTFTPDHPALIAAAKHDFEAFAEAELPGRNEFQYPPCAAMIRTIVRSPVDSAAESFAEALADAIRNEAEKNGVDARVLGPAPAPIAKLRGNFRYHCLLQSNDGDGLRAIMQTVRDQIQAADDVQWVIDVDPLSML